MMSQSHREEGHSQDRPPPLTLQQQQQQQQQKHSPVTASTQYRRSAKPEAQTSDTDYVYITYLVPDFFINLLEIKPQSNIPGHLENPRISTMNEMGDDQQRDIFHNADTSMDIIKFLDRNIMMTFPSEFSTFQTHMPNRGGLINNYDIKCCDDFYYHSEADYFKRTLNAARGSLLPIYNVQQKQRLDRDNDFVVFGGVHDLQMDSNKSPEPMEPLVSQLKVKLKNTGCDFPRPIVVSDEVGRHPRLSCLVIVNDICNFVRASFDDEQSGGLSPGAGLEPVTPTTEKTLSGSNCQFGPERSRNLSRDAAGSDPVQGQNHHKSRADCSKSYYNDEMDKNKLMLTVKDAKYHELLTTSFMLPSVIIILMRRLSEWITYATGPKLVSFLSMFGYRKISLILHHQMSLNKTTMDSDNCPEKHLFNAINKINTDVGDDEEQTYKQIKSSHIKSASMIEAHNSTKGLQMGTPVTIAQTLAQSNSGIISNNTHTYISKHHRSQQGQGHSWFSYDSSCLGFGMDSENKSSKRRRLSGKTKSFPRFLCFLLFISFFLDSASAQRLRKGRQSVVTTVESGGWLLSNLLSLPNECTMEGALAPCTFLLTCLIQGGSPVNKCGGGYIYTCCVPTRMSARGAMSVRSDHRPSMPTLRHIGSLFRDAPSPSHAIPQSNLILPHRIPPREIMSPSRLPWRQKGTWFSDERLDRNYDHNTDGAHGNSLVPIGHNVVSSEDALSSFSLGTSSQDLGFALNYKPPVTTNEIYYNEPECGVQKLSTTQISKRIIGGNEAQFAELPWQAHIRIAGYQCGGVLVNRYYVATAAHCVHKARLRDITIHLGEFDTKDTGRHYEPYPKESFGVVEKRTHPNFKYMLTQPDRFDVAVLRLSRPAQYRPNIVPICLPPPGDHFSGMTGIVAGWGKTDNSYGKTGTNILRKVSVPIIDNHECLRWHHRKNIDVKLHYEMFCAGHSQGKMDACLGDSGGPLVVNNKGRWTLAGITSAGFGCAVDHQPGIYHKVAITSGWIAANVRP